MGNRRVVVGWSRPARCEGVCIELHCKRLRINGCRALVSGAGRGIGRGVVEGLLARGAERVYAGVRELTVPVPEGSIPVLLDVTDADQVQAAASRAGDVTLVVNNAGVCGARPALAATDPDGARLEMEVNYFGTLSMCRAFAPVLGANGGGVLVNVLSVVSWFAPPEVGSYAASKSAQWALTNSLRAELRGQCTQVVGLHCGYVDTNMSAGVIGPKLSVAEVATALLDGVEAGVPEVVVDQRSRDIKMMLPRDQQLLY